MPIMKVLGVTSTVLREKRKLATISALAFFVSGLVFVFNPAQAPVTQAATSTFTGQVNASANDVNETGSTLSASDGTVWIGSNNSANSYAGLRFTNVTVPAGAVINSAHLEVYSTQSQWISYTFTLGAESVGNSAAFSTSSRPSQRTQTTAKVSHSDNTQWQTNTWYSLDEMKTVIQEVVNRPDWVSGNSISVIAKATSAGFGRKFFRGYDGGSANAAKLVINYTDNSAPTANISVSPTSVISGSASTLSWSTTNATAVSIDQGVGTVASSGSISVSPSATTTYTITASNSGGSTTNTATLTVTPPLPTASLSVTPQTIDSGDSATLTWTTSGATSVSINHGIGSVSASGSVSVNPTATTTYVITATNASGNTTDSATLTVNPPLPTTTFSASPGSVTEGSSATLMWTTANASTVSIDNGVGTVAANGSVSVTPAVTTTYTLTASNSTGSVTKTATVTVTQVVPTVSLSLNPTTIISGQSATLTWNSSHADSLSIDQGIGTVAASGSMTVNPTSTTAYTITAVNTAGQDSASATLTVNPAPPLPTVTLSANPETIVAGNSSTLSWTSANADTVSINNGIGQVAASGNRSVSPSTTTTYVITANNYSGTATQSVTVTVNPPLPTASISANPNPVTVGSSAALSWSTTNAASVSIDHGIGTVASSGSMQVTPSATTTYILTATNITGSTTASVTLTVSTTPPPPVNLTAQINSSADDVNETSNSLTANGSTLFLGSNNSLSSYTGLRFNNLTIPAGANITNAHLEVYSTQSQWITYAFNLNAESAGNSLPFSTTARPSQRTLTSAQVVHNDNVQWQTNTWYSLDEIKTVIQEVVNRPDWQSGNSISIITKATTANFARKFFRAFDGGAANAPKLVLTYSTGGVTPPPPPPLPTASLTATPVNVVTGSPSTLSWTTTNASNISINQGIGAVAANGSVSVTPTSTTTYTLTATNVTGSAIDTATVTVTPYTPPSGVNFYNIGTPAASNGGYDAVSWSGANPLIVDQYGKYISAVQDYTAGSYRFEYSNDKGASWNEINANQFLFRESLVYDPASDVLHSVTTSDGIVYRRFKITRAANNNITNISLDPAFSSMLLDGTSGCSGLDARNPMAFWKDNGGQGMLVIMWSIQKTCGGVTITENRASMRVLSNNAQDAVAVNWKALNGASDAPSATGPAAVPYNALYKYVGAYRPFQHSALITGSGGRADDIYYFNVDQNNTHGFRRLAWNSANGDWSGNWTARATFGGNINDSQGYSLKQELISKPVYDSAHSRVYVGIAKWLDNTNGDTQSLYYVDVNDGISLAGNVYSAGGTHCIYPTFDLMYDDVTGKVYVFYDISGNNSVCGHTYYKTFDGSAFSAAQPFFTVPNQSVDIPIVYKGRDNDRAILFFRKNRVDDNFNPPHEVFFGYVNLPAAPNPPTNSALSFDSLTDTASATLYPSSTGTQTTEAWVKPNSNNAYGIVMDTRNEADDQGWIVELRNGQAEFWVADPQGVDRNLLHTGVTMTANNWYHIAATYNATTHIAQVFVNGTPSATADMGVLSQGPSFRMGKFGAFDSFLGTVDEVRVSNNIRYTGTFTPPNYNLPNDANTLLLYHFNEGSGQTVADSSANARTLTLGASSSVESVDPVWVASTAPNNGTPPGSGTFTNFSVNSGFTDVISHQLVRTASDKLYAFAGNTDSTTVKSYWTSATGLPASTAAFSGSAQITLPSKPLTVDAAYDGANTVHVLTNLNNGNLIDTPFDLVTNTFKSSKTLATGNPTVGGEYIGSSGVSSMVDSANILHVAYWAAGNQIIHASYAYDSATDALTVASAATRVDTAGSANHPAIAVSPLDNSVTVSWASQATTPKRILVRSRTAAGVWGSVENVSNTSVDAWTSTNSGINIDQGPSIIITADGAKHVVYIENFDGTGNYGSVHYSRYNGTAWTDQEIPQMYSHDPALATNAAGDIYIVGHGHPNNVTGPCLSEDDMCVKKRNADGSWATSQLFAQHPAGQSFDASPSIKWSAVGWNRPEAIEFLFFRTPYQTPTLYYGRID